MRNRNNRNKYAIVFLCMLKEHYVIGACITAFVHRTLLNKIDQKIDLIIMCDDNIYNKYAKILRLFFDKVKRIKLTYYDISTKYMYSKEKYASWVSYATNKWKCLKLIRYSKILFLDVDMLPAQLEFYSIFNLDAPAILRCQMFPKYEPECNEIFRPDTGNSYDDFIVNHSLKTGSLDAGIVLLEPSLDFYKKYKKMTHKLFKKNGIYATKLSFPDEMSLFYLMSKEPTITIHSICSKYSIIPWENVEGAKTALLYNFNSFYKPWIKSRLLCFRDEIIWHDIFDRLILDIEEPSKTTLIDLYNKSIIDHYNDYLKLDVSKQRSRYNTQNINIIKNIKNITIENINKGNNNKHTYEYIKINELKDCLD